jgi:predicted dehydrogenase
LEDVDLVIRKNETPPRRLTFERVDALRCELEEFAKAIATGKPYPISFEDMIDAVAATEAIIKSLETGNSTAVSMR